MELPEKGSRWYIAGRHWQVTGHTVKEGEPAITARALPLRKRQTTFTWIWRLVARRALPSNWGA